MNWVGGVRNRLKGQREKKLQKEFFERKRFLSKQKKGYHKCYSQPEKDKRSQDLRAIRSLNQAHTHETTDSGVRRYQHHRLVRNLKLEKSHTSGRDVKHVEIPSTSPSPEPSSLLLHDVYSEREEKKQLLPLSNNNIIKFPMQLPQKEPKAQIPHVSPFTTPLTVGIDRIQGILTSMKPSSSMNKLETIPEHPFVNSATKPKVPVLEEFEASPSNFHQLETISEHLLFNSATTPKTPGFEDFQATPLGKYVSWFDDSPLLEYEENQIVPFSEPRDLQPKGFNKATTTTSKFSAYAGKALDFNDGIKPSEPNAYSSLSNDMSNHSSDKVDNNFVDTHRMPKKAIKKNLMNANDNCISQSSEILCNNTLNTKVKYGHDQECNPYRDAPSSSSDKNNFHYTDKTITQPSNPKMAAEPDAKVPLNFPIDIPICGSYDGELQKLQGGRTCSSTPSLHQKDIPTSCRLLRESTECKTDNSIDHPLSFEELEYNCEKEGLPVDHQTSLVSPSKVCQGLFCNIQNSSSINSGYSRWKIEDSTSTPLLTSQEDAFSSPGSEKFFPTQMSFLQAFNCIKAKRSEMTNKIRDETVKEVLLELDELEQNPLDDSGNGNDNVPLENNKGIKEGVVETENQKMESRGDDIKCNSIDCKDTFTHECTRSPGTIQNGISNSQELLVTCKSSEETQKDEMDTLNKSDHGSSPNQDWFSSCGSPKNNVPFKSVVSEITYDSKSSQRVHVATQTDTFNSDASTSCDTHYNEASTQWDSNDFISVEGTESNSHLQNSDVVTSKCVDIPPESLSGAVNNVEKIYSLRPRKKKGLV